MSHRRAPCRRRPKPQDPKSQVKSPALGRWLVSVRGLCSGGWREASRTTPERLGRPGEAACLCTWATWVLSLRGSPGGQCPPPSRPVHRWLSGYRHGAQAQAPCAHQHLLPPVPLSRPLGPLRACHAIPPPRLAASPCAPWPPAPSHPACQPLRPSGSLMAPEVGCGLVGPVHGAGHREQAWGFSVTSPLGASPRPCVAVVGDGVWATRSGSPQALCEPRPRGSTPPGPVLSPPTFWLGRTGGGPCWKPGCMVTAAPGQRLCLH